MSEFFAMGGYAFYVWVSYALVAAVLVGNAVVALQWHRGLVRGLARRRTFENRAAPRAKSPKMETW
jgi:heme exporter protein D